MTITGNQLIGYAQPGTGSEKFSGPLKNADGVPYSFHEATTAEIDEAIRKANVARSITK